MNAPTVSIVIAAHNEAAMLAGCLQSLHAQTYPKERLRVIVVDDHSTDGTAAIGRANGATVITATARGASAARNQGIRANTDELIGSLDAHMVASPDWVRTLAEAFADPRVGGAQATTISRATDPKVDRYVSRAPRYGNDGLVAQTIDGRQSLYPWMLSGNCMYRRRAIDDAGSFDETLVACEDVDLAWRVVLSGYLLSYVAEAEAAHYEGLPWSRFARKGWRYGQGAAQVRARYAPHGARSDLAAPIRLNSPFVETASTLYYFAGYVRERLRAGHAGPRRDIERVRRFREPFAWTATSTLRISDHAVYWLRGANESVVVHLTRRQRLVLAKVANFIWRELADGRSRAGAAHAVVEAYGIAQRTAESDLDDFVEELRELQMVVRD